MFLIRGAGLVLGSTDYSYCYFYILYVIYICYHYHVHLLVLLLQSLFIGIIVITTITYIINYIYIYVWVSVIVIISITKILSSVTLPTRPYWRPRMPAASRLDPRNSCRPQSRGRGEIPDTSCKDI